MAYDKTRRKGDGARLLILRPWVLDPHPKRHDLFCFCRSMLSESSAGGGRLLRSRSVSVYDCPYYLSTVLL